MSTKIEPTGRFRFRSQRRFLASDVLVVQVEFRTFGHEVDFSFGECYTRDVDRKWWRDAFVEDLANIQWCRGKE